MYKRQSGGANLILIIVLVVLLLIGTGWFVWSRQDDNNNVTETTTDLTTQVTPKLVEKEENKAEAILEVELLLQHSSDEDLLPTETAVTFIEYMASRLNDFECDFVESPSAGFGITKISPRFVSGSISCLGGAATVWYLTTAGWEELGYQSYVPCSRLAELAIPSDFLSECYDDTSPGEEIIPNPNGPL